MWQSRKDIWATLPPLPRPPSHCSTTTLLSAESASAAANRLGRKPTGWFWRPGQLPRHGWLPLRGLPASPLAAGVSR
eukprot:5347537-Lingulodinium_polyedra.AAC.1